MALYDAFISYSHAQDKPIAAALQSAVQKLGKPWYRRRALRVFRDDTSLSATPSLWPSIEQALGQSRYFLLLASPQAAASKWVNKEVSHWLEHHGIDTLLIGLTDGALAWDDQAGGFRTGEVSPLPPVLAGRFSSEPKWVDLTAYRAGAHTGDARFTELAADFAATLHGIPKEDLLSQEVRQQRRALTQALSAAAALFVFAGLAGWQWYEALIQQREAIAQRLEAEAQRQEATVQRREAIAQRDLAQRNYGAAKAAVDSLVSDIAAEFRDVEGVRTSVIIHVLDAAKTNFARLAEINPDDTALQTSYAAMLNDFAATYLRAGDTARAREATAESLTIFRRLAAAEPHSNRRLIDVAAALDTTGDIRLFEGDHAGALAAFEESLAIARQLVAAEPGNAAFQRGLSVSLEKIGRLRQLENNNAGALAFYEESLAVRRRLAAATPQDSEPQRDLAIILNHIGDVRADEREYPAALTAYNESLTIVRRLADLHPENTDWRRSLEDGLNRTGRVHLMAGDIRAAIRTFEEALAIGRKLAAADPGNAEWQRDLLVILRNLGTAHEHAGDLAGAARIVDESLTVARKLAAADPESAQAQIDVADALHKLGNLLVTNRARARAALAEALAIVERLERAGKLPPGRKSWPDELRVLVLATR